MTDLEKLKVASSLHDVAHLLGFKPKLLAYILYIKPSSEKYTQFTIAKRSGGKRLISAPYPNLKTLQKRLSTLLENCVADINKIRNIKSSLSHGFRRKHSIITNADNHRNKRYVFNIDLENFFGTINFGRVRGFFITNRNFELNPAVATVLAQIVCHENALPQGSPCSPVISNLIGHLLDIRLAALAHQVSCRYSRYADDLTFSTNNRNFPTEVASLVADGLHQWQVGKKLEGIIKKAGFIINTAKIRMQYMDSRQDVTGLVVNSKINTRAEYRRTTRAMVYRLLKTGKFQRKVTIRDAAENLVVIEEDGTLDKLNGMLSFIDSVNQFNIVKQNNKNKMAQSASKEKKDTFLPNEKIYPRFLIFKNFFASSCPVIVCEGKTDNIYIKSAIRQLIDDYPRLAEKKASGFISLRIKLFRYTNTSGNILGLTGGAGSLKNFINLYITECTKIAASGMTHPIILLIDNDKAGRDIISTAREIKKQTEPNFHSIDPNVPYIFVNKNLYIVPTPLASDNSETTTENFFDAHLLNTKIRDKKFNPNKKGFDKKTEYGKSVFAEHVVKKHEKDINFSGFKPILDRIVSVLDEHDKKKTA